MSSSINDAHADAGGELAALRARVNELTEDRHQLVAITEQLEKELSAGKSFAASSSTKLTKGSKLKGKSKFSDSEEVASLRAELRELRDQLEDVRFVMLYGESDKDKEIAQLKSVLNERSAHSGDVNTDASTTTSTIQHSQASSEIKLTSFTPADRLALMNEWLWQSDLMQVL